MAYGNYAPFYRGGYFNPMQSPTMPNMAENNQWQLQNMQQPPIQPLSQPTTEIQKTHENAPITHECKCSSKFVTIEEFNALKGKFYDLLARYDKLMLEEKENVVEKPKTTTKKTKESEE